MYICCLLLFVHTYINMLIQQNTESDDIALSNYLGVVHQSKYAFNIIVHSGSNAQWVGYSLYGKSSVAAGPVNLHQHVAILCVSNGGTLRTF